MSPTLKVNLTLFFVPYIFVGFCRFTILLLLSLTKCVFIQNLVIHDNTSLHKCLDAKCTELCFKNCHGFPQLSIIRDNPRNLIHKKCHRKSYHKWHKKTMTTKTILGVPTCTIVWTSWWTVVWKWIKLQWQCRWYADQILKHLTCTHGWCMRVLSHVLSVSVCTGISSIFCNR